MARRRRKKRIGRLDRDLERVNEHAAGVDIGSESHWVAVDPSVGEDTVREFRSYTDDLAAMADWLQSVGVKTVAMESTGVYWVPLYELLRTRGFEVYLVDARATKQVAGRKTDISDCQWIQQLHSYGLLKPAFIPDETVSELRAYMRQRERWVADAGRAVQHMQQALELMNVKLTEVVRNIVGKTGLGIIDAILAGERDPQKLSLIRDPRCKRTSSELARALRGTWHEQHMFALDQARHHYNYLGDRIADCDRRIDRVLARLAPPSDPPQDPGSRKRESGPHPFGFDATRYCMQMAGVDLTTIDGVGANTALTILAEIGPDLSAWRNEKAFGSWLGLAPNPRKSGGRVLRSSTMPNANRIATALRLAARALSNSKSALGAYYRRLRARIGPPKAITATAYKLARIIYRMLSTKQPYRDVGQAAYDQRFHARRLRSLQRSAKAMGFQLVPVQASGLS